MAATSPPDAGGAGGAHAGGGSFLTRKLGPFPMWVWVGLGVAAAYWYMSKKNASSTAATDAQQLATQSALANQGAAAMQYGYSAPDLASMLSNLQSQVSLLGAGNNGTTSTPSTSPGSTGQPATAPTPVLAHGGSGFYVPGSSAPITGQGGHTYEWIQTAQVLRNLAGKVPLYWQPAPYVFQPSPKNISPGTPQFIQVS